MIVAENAQMKIARSTHYNYDFYKGTGLHLRWGKTREDDPQVAPAPEILDIEISTGDCSGKCEFCYKSNSVGNGKHMSLRTFSAILDKFMVETIAIELEDGRVYQVSPNHRVRLPDGKMVMAYELRDGDEIVSL